MTEEMKVVRVFDGVDTIGNITKIVVFKRGLNYNPKKDLQSHIRQSLMETSGGKPCYLATWEIEKGSWKFKVWRLGKFEQLDRYLGEMDKNEMDRFMKAGEPLPESFFKRGQNSLRLLLIYKILSAIAGLVGALIIWYNYLR